MIDNVTQPYDVIVVTVQLACCVAYPLVYECELNHLIPRHVFSWCVDNVVIVVVHVVVITAAIGARKPATARHNDAFVNRDHSTSSVYTPNNSQLVDQFTIYLIFTS